MKLSIVRQILKDAWRAIKLGYLSSRRDHYGYIHDTAKVFQPTCGVKQNVFLYENTKIGEYSKFITSSGKFILKKYSRAGMGLTVITFNHNIVDYDHLGGDKYSQCIADDVVVNEEVLIGCNVTLCPGTHIGRGCTIAAGSVCVRTKEYPAYSIIGGNPAKFIKFKFSLEEQIRHEEKVYTEIERIPIEILNSNYIKFSNKNLCLLPQE